MPCLLFEQLWGSVWKNLVLALNQFNTAPVTVSGAPDLKVHLQNIDIHWSAVKDALNKHVNQGVLQRISKDTANTVIYIWPPLVDKELKILREELWLLDDPSFRKDFETTRAALREMLQGKENSMLADMLQLCVLTVTPEIPPVRLWRSGGWPTIKEDDRGYRQHRVEGTVEALAEKVVNAGLAYIQRTSLHDGNFDVPEGGGMKTYSAAGLQGAKQAEARIVFKFRQETVQEKRVLHVYFCFFVTKKMHQDDYGSNKCINAYSRLDHMKCSVSERFSFSSFGGWQEIRTIDEL